MRNFVPETSFTFASFLDSQLSHFFVNITALCSIYNSIVHRQKRQRSVSAKRTSMIITFFETSDDSNGSFGNHIKIFHLIHLFFTFVVKPHQATACSFKVASCRFTISQT